MSKPIIWLFEKDVFDEGNPEDMARIATGMGDEVHWVGYVPFGGDLRLPPLGKDDCVLAYGTINLARRLLSTSPCSPVAWFDENSLRCSTYLSHWGRHSVQEYVLVTWAELRRQGDMLYDALAEDGCLFFRPDNNLKTFPGKLVPREEFVHWHEMESDCHSPEACSLVMVSRPVNIAEEWRFVVRRGEVISGSFYKQQGRICLNPAWDERARILALEISREPWQPAPIYVLDVCQTRSGDFRLLEIGCVNTAGLYSCDLEKVVSAMRKQAIDELS